MADDLGLVLVEFFQQEEQLFPFLGAQGLEGVGAVGGLVPGGLLFPRICERSLHDTRHAEPSPPHPEFP